MSQKDEGPSTYELTLPTRATLLTITALVLAGLVFLFVETFNMTPSLLPGYPGDAFFPRLALGFTIVFAVIILFRGLFFAPDPAMLGFQLPTVSVHWLEFASVIALGFLYTLLLEPVGFEIVTLAFMMVLLVPRLGMRDNPRRAVLQALAMAVPAVLALYATFGVFLKIPLELKFLPVYIF